MWAQVSTLFRWTDHPEELLRYKTISARVNNMSSSHMDTGVPQVPSTGGVARLIHMYGQGVQNENSRHGTAERGRTRARSREGRREAQSLPVWRTDLLDAHRPSGPQEQMDWLGALDTFEDRMATVERTLRLHGQTIAVMEEQAVAHRRGSQTVSNDIEAYKKYVESRLQFIQTTTAKECERINNSINIGIDQALKALFQKVGRFEESFQTLEAQYKSLLEFIHKTGQREYMRGQQSESHGPQTFDIGTERGDPMQQAASDPWLMARDNLSGQEEQATTSEKPAWLAQQEFVAGRQAAQDAHRAFVVGNQAAQDARLLPPPSAPQEIPKMPSSFQAGGPGGPGFNSPFDPPKTPPTTRNPYNSPQGQWPPGGCHAQDMGPFNGMQQARPAPVQQNHFLHPSHGNPGAYHMGGAPNQRTSTFDISYKPNESLKKFDGDSAKYRTWSDRMLDHLARANTQWRHLIKGLQIAEFPITKAWLLDQWIDGHNGWELSERLETFLCMWVSDKIYGRRVQLAGGESQQGNGFEIWRKLYLEHHGGAEAVKLGGIRRLQEWPKCKDASHLAQHLDSWLECLETHNQELMHAPNILRSMILGIIPTDYEDEILVRPEIVSYLDIVDFCKRRLTYRRQKELSELTRRPPNEARINALKGDEGADDEKMPSWAMKLFKAIPKVPAPHPAPRPAKPESRGRQEEEEDSISAAIRAASPSSRRAFNLKFRFNGCWHCGEKGHSRKPNPAKGITGCPKFKKLKQQHGGGPPQGYKGAYEKARDAAWEKFQKTKGGKVNMLEADESEPEDDKSEYSDNDGEIIFSLRGNGEQPPSFAHQNAFEALDDGEEEMDDEVINHFAKWAHKVQRAKQSAQKDDPPKTVRITSLQELDTQMAIDPRLAALPIHSKKLSRKIRKLESQQFQLEDDEMLCLVDTGSSLHAADAEIHFPEYLKTVKPSSASRRGHAATSAGGHRLENLGKFTVNAVTDGQDVKVPFNHMKVKIPILSVREMMSKGSYMTLTEDGGKIVNQNIGRCVNFFVHDDLWYMKFKVKPPNEQAQSQLPDSLFGRQGKR